MRLVVAVALLAWLLTPFAVARAADGPYHPDRDLSISTTPGLSAGKTQGALQLDLTVLARRRWLMLGGTLQQAFGIPGLLQYAGAVHAGYGWRSPTLDFELGGTWRVGLLGTFGVRRYVALQPTFDDDEGRDPGTSVTMPFAGGRASLSAVTGPHAHTHFLIGLILTVEANLGPTTVHYAFSDDGELQHRSVPLGGPRYGLMLDLGVLRDLR
jgi:hypothetical protein